jgi:uncharacterized membrane protein YedE/YeeE
VRRLAGFVVGLVFGVTLSWTGMSDPDVIRGALLFQESYLFLFFASAVLTATAGVWLLRRRRGRALLTGERIDWRSTPVQRRHVVGSVLFGTGWALADACPGPIAAQLGQGIAWSLCTIVGVIAGIWLFLRRSPSAIDA